VDLALHSPSIIPALEQCYPLVLLDIGSKVGKHPSTGSYKKFFKLAHKSAFIS